MEGGQDAAARERLRTSIVSSIASSVTSSRTRTLQHLARTSVGSPRRPPLLTLEGTQLDEESRELTSDSGDRRARLRRFIRHRRFQAASLICLLVALFLPNVWTLADRPDNSDLDVLLTAVLLLFVLEFALQLAASPNYPGSTFFWMDILGAASLFLDLSYSPLFAAEWAASHGGFVLTARLAKLAARAGRLGRLGKLLRFLPGLREDTSSETGMADMDLRGCQTDVLPGMAAAMWYMLNRALSVHVSCLLLVLVGGVPLFSVFTYPQHDWSMVSWLLILEATGQRMPEQLSEQLAQFEHFYASLPYFPYQLELSLSDSNSSPVTLGDEQGHQVRVAWKPHDTGRGAPSRRWNVRRIETEHASCLFNFSEPMRWAAAMDMALTLMIMLLMIFFTGFLSNSVSRIVCQPLRRLLGSIVVASKEIFNSVTRIANKAAGEESISPDLLSVRRLSTGSCGAAAVAEREVGVLEDAFDKLSFVAQHMVGDMDQADELGDEGKHIITSYRYSSDSTSTDTSQRTSGCKLSLDTQLAVIQSVGLSPELVDSWSLNPLALDKPRCHAACLFFLGPHNHGVEAEPVTLQTFICTVESSYNTVPYHSWFHAVDVTHGMYRFLKLFHGHLFLDSIERYALLVSAVAHDCSHPGIKNQFLVETSHDLALRYNDQSPLENMHCTRLFEILALPRNNIFDALSKRQFRQARQVCLEAILHTDSSIHFQMVKELQLFYEMNLPVLGDALQFYTVDPDDFPTKDSLECYQRPETRELLWRLLLHLSDLSNPTKPFRICCIWAHRCLDEFFAQGDRELEAGLPVQPLHNREKTDRNYSQIGFIEFLMAPLALVTTKLLPPFLPCADQLLDNLRHWQAVWLTESLPSDRERAAVEERLRRLERRFADDGK